MHRTIRAFAITGFFLAACGAQNVPYDLLLQGGHVVDAKNKISGTRDVAIADGRIAAVEPHIDPSKAAKTVDVSGLYVTPGLVDIHMHVYTYTGQAGSKANDHGIMPDNFTFRTGVTTVVDPGSSGWRTFQDFKARVIDPSRTRVFGMLNIVGWGMRGGAFEQDLSDMDGTLTGQMAQKYPGVIVGVKSAHFAGPEWKPYEQAVKAGTIAHIPVMIDYGSNRTERPLYELLTRVLRPGDIYTHSYSGLRGEQAEDGGPSQAMIEGRKRGIIFDVGHGSGSFFWRIAEPMVKAGFQPDSISTDLHTSSMNFTSRDLLNVVDKFLAMGLSVEDVLVRASWNPAREIQHPELGNLSVGSVADVAVFRVETGKFGFADPYGARETGTQKLVCELTVRNGKVVFDLNAMTGEPWTKLPPKYKRVSSPRWDAQAGPAH